MKIYVSHASASDFTRELYEPLKNSEFAGNHSFFFPYEAGVETDTREIVRGADLMLAEVSLPSTGQGIELGWASDDGKRIVCVSKEGVHPSTALSFVPHESITYMHTEDLLSKLSKIL
jgi:hypothetical protein